MSLDGRWTIRLDHAGNELAPAQPEPSDKFVPVVPCDDAAIERVAKWICGESGGWDDGPDEAWDREPEMHETWRALAAEFLAAATGETP